MAIAGVGSFAHSLADGLAREGRVILGGDASFSLIHREASAAGALVPGEPRPGFARRHHAGDGARVRRTRQPGRDQGGRRAYPLYGAVRLEACGRSGGRARRARRGSWRGRRRGAVRTPRPGAGRAPRRRQHSGRGARRAQERARQARRRHRLRAAPPDERRGVAGDRPAAAGQPGALALPGEAAAERRHRPCGGRGGAKPPGRRCPTPAGTCARGTRPRPSSSAISSASPSSSPWSD